MFIIKIFTRGSYEKIQLLLFSSLLILNNFFIKSAESNNFLNQIRSAVYNNDTKTLQNFLNNHSCFAGARTENNIPILVASSDMTPEITALLLLGKASPMDQDPERKTALDILLLQTITHHKTDDVDQLRRIELLVKDLKTRNKIGEQTIKSSKTYWNRISAQHKDQQKIRSILNGKSDYNNPQLSIKDTVRTASPTPTPSIHESENFERLDQLTPQPTPPDTPTLIEIEDDFTTINFEDASENPDKKPSSWWPW